VNAALAGLEAEKKKLDAQIAQMQALLGTAPKRGGRPPKNVLPAAEPATQEAAARRKRRKMGPVGSKTTIRLHEETMGSRETCRPDNSLSSSFRMTWESLRLRTAAFAFR
jgi:hypothetical protein